MASVDWWTGIRQTLLCIAWAASMYFSYSRIARLFDSEPLVRRWAAPASLLLLLCAGLDFLAIRGGVGASVANVSKVYFSTNPFLNHAATNPVFSFLSSLGKREDFASEYLFSTNRSGPNDSKRFAETGRSNRAPQNRSYANRDPTLW